LKLLSRAHKKLSAISAWENSKKASVEAELKKIEVRIDFIANSNMFYFLLFHIFKSWFLVMLSAMMWPKRGTN